MRRIGTTRAPCAQPGGCAARRTVVTYSLASTRSHHVAAAPARTGTPTRYAVVVVHPTDARARYVVVASAYTDAHARRVAVTSLTSTRTVSWSHRCTPTPMHTYPVPLASPVTSRSRRTPATVVRTPDLHLTPAPLTPARVAQREFQMCARPVSPPLLRVRRPVTPWPAVSVSAPLCAIAAPRPPAVGCCARVGNAAARARTCRFVRPQRHHGPPGSR